MTLPMVTKEIVPNQYHDLKLSWKEVDLVVLMIGHDEIKEHLDKAGRQNRAGYPSHLQPCRAYIICAGENPWPMKKVMLVSVHVRKAIKMCPLVNELKSCPGSKHAYVVPVSIGRCWIRYLKPFGWNRTMTFPS